MSSCCPEDQPQSNSSFLLGLLMGAVIGAVIAVIIYKNNKSQVLEDFQKKLQDIFGQLTQSASKKEKNSPRKPKFEIEFVESQAKSSPPRKSTPRMFVKPKK